MLSILMQIREGFVFIQVLFSWVLPGSFLLITVLADIFLCVHIQGVAINFDGGILCHAGAHRSPGAVASPTLEQMLLLAQNVSPDDLPEGLSELPYPVGVDEWVDHRIAVGQDDGQVHEPGRGPQALRTEVGEAVNDVERKPADGKQPHDDGQGFGRVDLLLEDGAALLPLDGLEFDQLELVPSRHENPQVDPQHEQQGHKDKGEEVEVDHVIHGDHVLKEARHHAVICALYMIYWGAVFGGLTSTFVPAQHGRQSNDDREDPADGDDPFSSLTRHQTIIPETTLRKQSYSCH